MFLLSSAFFPNESETKRDMFNRFGLGTESARIAKHYLVSFGFIGTPVRPISNLPWMEGYDMIWIDYYEGFEVWNF